MVKRLTLITCAFALIGAAPLPNRTFVVRSVGPDAQSWPKGKVVPRGTNVALKSGSVVQILDNLGTRTFRGPGQFVIGSASAENSRADGLARAMTVDQRRNRAAAVTLSDLLVAGTKRRVTRSGAVRGSGEPVSMSRQWHELVLGQSGPFCATNPLMVSLWRNTTTTTERVELRAAPGDKLFPAGFHEGLTRTTVLLGTAADKPPKTLRYVMADGDKIEVNLIALTPADRQSLTTLYQALNQKGCEAQADALIGDVEQAQGSDDSSAAAG
jgi:hypothetical protein